MLSHICFAAHAGPCVTDGRSFVIEWDAFPNWEPAGNDTAFAL